PRPLSTTPIPYTTLFRSGILLDDTHGHAAMLEFRDSPQHDAPQQRLQPGPGGPAGAYQPMYWPPFAARLAPVIQAASSGRKNARSEEHTSELQSREKLVC